MGHLEQDLILVGLIGMIDPPRPEVGEAVRLCKAAGIRPVMITGDHPLTARHIAQSLGISNDDRFMMGEELEKMPDADLRRAASEVAVFARACSESRAVIGAALIAGKGAPQMADVAYALVLLGGFLVLVLTLRGLERL